ncbi:aldo/keto reductase [Pontibacter sp. G13]|uniref:aldo/keto reductase n=1 Tax=Pontibacter sp. G13 TaxID=3074898 RepID=UPI00288A931F|nr:aldo/keto reductase [Pontibacter sp. G13]WNJ20900.1 aldo/keto reductase [Pontibacter sp. G13]
MMNTNDHRPIASYLPNAERYQPDFYKPAGQSGLQLPLVSLGLWHNFGEGDDLFECRNILRKAFDLGITHFDLANNYGPPYGAAEENFGRLFKRDFAGYRDELIISTKAGYDMWAGPYGRGGSRKYLMSSLDQSLKRMGLEYVDIFYHHCPDPRTPLKETVLALADICRQGKALYIGISNYYEVDQMKEMCRLMEHYEVPFVLNQLKYSMFERKAEAQMEFAEEAGYGVIAFSPLAQGLLTDKYLNGIPKDSRAMNPKSYLKSGSITPEKLSQIEELNQIAASRNISLAQMALLWVLRQPAVCSVLAGVSRVKQLEENVKLVGQAPLTLEEQQQIEMILTGAKQQN